MKILYTGYAQGIDNAAQYYFFPQRLINGFTRLGHTVFIFNDRDVARYSNILRSSHIGRKAMNESFLQCCKEYCPDLIVLGHCEKITNETLQEIYIRLPNVKIIYTNVDPLNDRKTHTAILNRSKIVDGVFSTTAGDALKEFSNNKSFISFWPNLVDPSLDTGKAFLHKNKIDLFFAGEDLGKNDRRRLLLEELIPSLSNEIHFELIGCGLNDLKLKGSNYINYLSKSNSGLIINKTEEYYLYASDRMSHYMANGMMVYCPIKPHYDTIFGDDEIVTYSSVGDLAEKISYFHQNDDKRINMAQKGYKKIRKVFDCMLVAQYLIDMVFDNVLSNSDKILWPTTKY